MSNLIILAKDKSLYQKDLSVSGFSNKYVESKSKFQDKLIASEGDMIFIQSSFFNNLNDAKKFVGDLHSKFAKNKIFIINDGGDVRDVFSLLKRGASDFIEAPFTKRRVEELILKFATKLTGYESNEVYKLIEDELGIVGNSKVFQGFLGSMAKVYESNKPLMIVGEIGSEKFKIAHFFHHHGRFSLGKIIRSNVSNFMDNLNGFLDEILGLAAKANGGTLILEEINSFGNQSDFFLKKIIDIYSKEKLDKKLNVIFTFSQKGKQAFLGSDIKEINILEIPALRQLKADIPHMAARQLKKLSSNYGVEDVTIDEGAIAVLQSYDWPGNIFELFTMVDSLFIQAIKTDKTVIQNSDVPANLASENPVNSKPDTNFEIMSSDLKKARAIFEKQYISSQIKRFAGNISQTASFIGMERTALHRKLISLGIDSDFLRKSIRGEKD